MRKAQRHPQRVHQAFCENLGITCVQVIQCPLQASHQLHPVGWHRSQMVKVLSKFAPDVAL